MNRIIACSEYRRALAIIDAKERDRIYCRHSYDHLLSVARLMYIEALEKGIDIDREVIYATALLHDIGRSVSDECHDIESAKIAVHILDICGYNESEITTIKDAILVHREGDDSLLGGMLYRADKMSRDCYYCMSQDTCKWIKKNGGIIR